MKKILSTLALSAVVTTLATADLIRLEMGAGAWQQSPSGTITYEDSTGASGKYCSNETDYTGAYVWLLLKHPVPIIPNVRLEYTKVKDKGTATGTFDDFTAPTGSPSSLEMSEYDIIPYYNILDNTFWTTIDLGIDVKVVDSTYSAEGVTIHGIGTVGTYTDSTTFAIPMVYGRARVEIPGTQIGLESDVKYITYDGSTVYDIRAKIDYTFDFNFIQPGIEIGYRTQKFDIKDDDDKTKIEIDFSGVYAGFMLRF